MKQNINGLLTICNFGKNLLLFSWFSLQQIMHIFKKKSLLTDQEILYVIFVPLNDIVMYGVSYK